MDAKLKTATAFLYEPSNKTRLIADQWKQWAKVTITLDDMHRPPQLVDYDGKTYIICSTYRTFSK